MVIHTAHLLWRARFFGRLEETRLVQVGRDGVVRVWSDDMGRFTREHRLSNDMCGRIIESARRGCTEEMAPWEPAPFQRQD